MSVDKDRWKLNSHCKYNLGVHIIFCPKYRRKVLIGEVERDFKTLCNEVSEKIGVEIISMEVMPDHVHLFIKYPPTLAVHYIVKQIKGTTSKVLRARYSSLRSRIPTLWTRSYFAESVGIIKEENIKKYIENQKNV